MTPDHSHTWIARAPCGCIRGAVVDDGRRTIASLRDWERRGYQVARVPSADLRTASWRCGLAHCPFEQTTANPAGLYDEGRA